MQITAVKLENAKSYDNALIEFTPGVNAIVGHNGAGKSTVLEAIGLAIFDELRYKQSEFVRAGTRTATVTVTIESNLDERLYEVVRRLGGSNLHYVHDPETGVRICEGKADVLAFLREHLGVESTTDLSALFRDAVGVGQGTFTAAFLGTPAQRKAVFDPLLQVEDYRKAVDLLRAPGRLLDERRQSLAVSIADLRARLDALPALRQAVDARRGGTARGAAGAREVAPPTRCRSGAEERAGSRAHGTGGVALGPQPRPGPATGHGARTGRGPASAGGFRRRAGARAETHAGVRALSGRPGAAEGAGRPCARAATSGGGARAGGPRRRRRGDSPQRNCSEELSGIAEAVAALERLKDPVRRQDDLDAQIAQARQDAVRWKDVQDQVARQRAQLEQLSATSARLTTAMARSADLEARAATLHTDTEEAQRTIDALRDDGARMKTEAEALKEQTSALADIATAVCPVCEQPLTGEHRENLLRRNEERLAGLRADYGEHLGRINALQAESTEKRTLLQGVERELRDLPRASELERLDRDAATLQASLDSLLAQEAELSGAAERIEALQASLAELGDPRRAYGLAQSQAARKGTVTAGIDQTSAELAAVRAKLDGMAAELGKFETLDHDLDACTAELRATEESYRAVLSNSRLAALVDQRAQEVERLTAAAQVLSQEIEQLSARVQATEARFDEEAYASVSAEEQTLRSALGALDARIDMMRNQQAADQAAILDLQAKQSTLAENEAAVTQVEAQAEMLETVRALLRQAGPYVTRVLIRQVSDNARQIYSDIMQDYTRHLGWNEEYGITLEVDGHEREFSQLSGGEQMTAALAVRLALLRELSSIDVAFFDEPTANLDEARRESLARQILEVKGFRQLFVISHDDTFEQATQNLIRVERINGASIVTTQGDMRG